MIEGYMFYFKVSLVNIWLSTDFSLERREEEHVDGGEVCPRN